MFKRVSIIVVVALLEASPLMAGIIFNGGDVTGTILLTPTQALSITGGAHLGTQGLGPGNMMRFQTTGMMGIAGDNQYLSRSADGTIGITTVNRQATNSSNAATGPCAGTQETAAAFTLTISDNVNLLGNGGNIRFESNSGADPSITFTAFTQTARHNVPAVGTSMAQGANITSTIASPGTAATPLSLIGIDEASGVVGFGSSVVSDIGRRQEFGGLFAAGDGIYGGEQETQDVVIMESTMEVGTTSEE